jgi:hypothetical protein
MPEFASDELARLLAAYGSDLSRWPERQAGRARAALLARPEFRRAFDQERALDRRIAEECARLDDEIARQGAVERVKRRLGGALRADPFADIGWRRIAAAVLIAGMLGGALDLLMPHASEAPEAAIETLYGAYAMDPR